jgi:tRNA1(Val) A37 N6-methylase TrmN6
VRPSDRISPRGGIIRAARRPPDWRAPGPRPPDAPERDELWPVEGEDLCWLAGDWRILQRLDGHRWSLDDLVTAWQAARECAAPPARAIDLGCGIGSVLLFLAWRFPDTPFVGVEAQDVSIGLARRSLAWNGLEARVTLVHADFREAPFDAAFELVTGTPPYFPPGSGIESDRVQRSPCRFEHRGGIEAYCAAAARALAPSGRFVACEAFAQVARVPEAARSAGLHVARRLDVVPRSGKTPLLSVFTFTREPATLELAPPLVVRDAAGRWTDDFRRLREEMGMPPGTDSY